MKRRHRRLSQRLTGVGLLSAMLITVVVALAISQSTDSIAGNVPIRAVYLADPLVPVLDVSTASARGIQTVTTVAELIEVAERSEVDAILLDRGPFDLIAPLWLTGQLRQGRVIVGFNVPPERLSQLPGIDPGVDSTGMRADWGSTPFYSLAYQIERHGRVSNAGLDSDAIQSSVVFLDRLSRKIEGIGYARAVAGQHSAPSATIRPTR